MRKTPDIPTAEEIAERADRGEDISERFTNSGKMKRPVQRVNIDGMTIEAVMVGRRAPLTDDGEERAIRSPVERGGGSCQLSRSGSNLGGTARS